MIRTKYEQKHSLLEKRKCILKKKITPSEKRIKSLLEELEIRVMFQKGFISKDNFCIVDFYFPQYKLVLEIDGGYHREIAQIKRDQNRDHYLSVTRPFCVLHITNELANVITKEELEKMLIKHKRTDKKHTEVIYIKYPF